MDLAAVRATAAKAWIYGHPMLENYRTMYAQAIDADDPRYVGGFGTFRHYSHPFTPENTDRYYLVIRLYGPDASAIDGSWRVPDLHAR